MKSKAFFLVVLVILDLMLQTSAGQNAYCDKIGDCLFTAWTKGTAVLSEEYSCSGDQLCYSTTGNDCTDAAQFASCYNETSLNPDFTGHIVLPKVKRVGGGKCTWHNEKGTYEPTAASNVDAGEDYDKTGQRSLYVYQQPTGEYFLSRGHYCANADFSTKQERELTYINTNVAPQWQEFNAQNWAKVEAAVRAYATSVNRKIYVVTGTGGQALTIPGGKPMFLNSKVVVPKYFWKVVCDPGKGGSVVFVAENPVGSRIKTQQTIAKDKCNDLPQTESRGVLKCYSLNDALKTFKDFMLPPLDSKNCKTSVAGAFLSNLLKFN